MRDYVTFSIRATENGKQYLHECKDSKSESGYSLLTWVDATHAGLVNGNMRFYRPDKMQDGCHTWTSKTRYNKPVLLRHDEDCDPVGRVVEAKYVDDSYKYVSQHAAVKSLLFYDSSSNKRFDLFKSVNWVYDTLQKRNRDFSGLGHCELGLNITNPDAIGKVQRGEYATVSVGFQTDSAICSICHQDWSLDGKCEHRLGAIVDGRRCFVISGNFEYDECSFVTHPADPFASVKNTEIIARAKDSMAMRVFMLGHSFDEEMGLFRMTDSLPAAAADMLESDIEIVSDFEKDTDMELDAIRAEINSKDLTKERALELRTALEGNADAKRLLTTLKAKITKQGWNEDASAPTQELVEARIATSVADFAALAADKRADFVAALEADASAFGLSVPGLTAEAALPATEVVPPAADSMEVASPWAAIVKDSKNGDCIVKHVDSTRALHDKLEDDSEKSLFRSAMGACMEVLSAEGWLSYMKGRVTSKDEVLVPRVEIDSLHEGVEAYEDTNKKLKDSNAVLAATNKTLMQDYKRAIATQVVMYSVLTGEAGFTDLSADQIQAEITERAGRQLISLQDSLKDLAKKLAGKIPEATSPEQAHVATDAAVVPPAAGTEVEVHEVSDSATVAESTADQPGVVPPAGDAPRGEGTVKRPLATLEDLKSMRKTAAVDTYRRLKENSTK
jgi:hypothetical protein